MRRAALAVTMVPLLAGCGQGIVKQSVATTAERPATDARSTLKAHLKSGDLVMFDSAWAFNDSTRVVTGFANRYDIARSLNSTGYDTVAVDDVALFEVDKPGSAFTFGMQGVALFTTWGAYVSGVCLADPKSCFGSCPTFYVEGDDTTLVQAEGFSSSVARVLEARDVDALARTRVTGGTVGIRMRNEALETHAVRRVALLEVPRPSSGRVFASGDTLFYPATHIAEPTRCDGPEGDCRSAVTRLDSTERTSRADSVDLATRETIELEWPARNARNGIVIGARAGLISTYLFYQVLAYLGTRAGDALASMERGTPEQARAMLALSRELGGIEISAPDSSGVWRIVGTYDEAGPIAGDVQVFPFPAHEHSDSSPLRVRLRMAKGAWRIDWVALATLSPPVSPIRIEPTRVEHDGVSDARARALLRDGDGHLVTQPGDEYRMTFELPAPAESMELFLESEGYYYEWIRGEWLAQENAANAFLAFTAPRETLRRLAAPYAAREVQMERRFWSSRFARRSHATSE